MNARTNGVALVGLVLGACGGGNATGCPEADTSRGLRSTFAPDAQGQLDAMCTKPGAAELRAKGCAQAIVTDYAKTDPTNKSVSLICKATGSLPSCDDLAKIYAKAVPGNASAMTITVYATGATTPSCNKNYTATGDPKSS